MKRSTIGVIVIIAVLGTGAVMLKSVVGGVLKAQAQTKEAAKRNSATVEKGDLVIQVVETGSLEPVREVEVKSRVGGRVARLLVEEGDYVKAGDLIAVIDPQETELRVEQNRAQLRGAESSVRAANVQIAQRRVTAQTNLQRTRSRLAQLEKELRTQPTLTNATIRSAEASLSTARKSHETLVRVTQPNAAVQARNAVTDARNNLQKAELDESRQRELFAKGYVAKRVHEQAELALQLAQTQLSAAQNSFDRLEDDHRLERERSQEQIRSAEAELNRARAGTIQNDAARAQYQQAVQDVRDAEVALRDIEALTEGRIGSQASVDQLKSVLRDSERELSETEIRAPIAGIVTKKHVQEGELVSSLGSFSEGTPVVEIEDRSDMRVRLSVNEIDVAKLKVGMPADITVDALPSEEFDGTVTKISPSMIESAAGGMGDAVVRYEVEVTLERVSSELKSGMSAKCAMKSLERLDVLTLPSSYVGKDDKGHFVMLKKDELDMNPVRTEVKVGAVSPAKIEIASGVTEGAVVGKPPFDGPERQSMMSMGPSEDEEEGEEGGETAE